MSVAEAKAHFAEAVKSAEAGEAVTITRYGSPVAVLVATKTIADLSRLREPTAERGLASLAGGWPGAAELAERIGEAHRSRSRSRRLPREKEM